MPNRTVKIRGYAFGEEPAEIMVTLAGTTIFSGPVPTVNREIPLLPFPEAGQLPDEVDLCLFELPIDFAGNTAMTCEVTSGTVIFTTIESNYTKETNSVFTEDDLGIIFSDVHLQEKYNVIAPHAVPPFTAEEESQIVSLGLNNPTVETILATHSVSIFVSSGPLSFKNIHIQSDERSNVVIDGELQIRPDEYSSADFNGTFWWSIPNGSILSYDLTVDAGLE